MSGYNLVRKIKFLEEECDRLGFMMCHARHYHQEFGDVVALKPKDADSVPVYSRDAEVFIGTLKELESWIQGLHFARKYDSMIFGTKHDARRVKKEDEFRHGQLLKKLKGTDSDKEQ
jgi:hypothetical protein